jgi:predicted enzyme related to lactoylglutathione lyase
MGEVSAYPNGTFCWVDLGTPDVAGAKAFYGELFGWDLEDVPGGGDATYTLCRLDGKLIAGIHQHAEDEGSDWSSSISVDDADAAAAKA